MKERPVVYLLARAPSSHDSRLFRQARFLAGKGCDVTIVATRYLDLPNREERDGYVVLRVPVDPLHYRFLRAFRFVAGAFHRMRRRLWRLLARGCRYLDRRSRSVGRRANRMAYRTVRRVDRRGRWVGRRVNRVVFRIMRRLLGLFGLWRENVDSQHAPLSGNASKDSGKSRAIGTGDKGWGGRVMNRSVSVSWWGRTWAGVAVRLVRVGPYMVVTFALLTVPAHLALFAIRQAVDLLLALDDHLYKLIRSLALKWALDRPLRLLDFTWRSYQVARGSGADVVQAKDLPALPSAYVVARLTGARLVYDSTELNLESGPSATLGGAAKWLLRRYEGFFARRSDAVVTVNESIGEILARSYGIARPFVVRNCADYVAELSEIAHLRKRFRLPEGRIVLYHGGFSANRGLHQLVESVSYLPDVTLVLMGYGPLEQPLRAHVERLGLKERIIIVDAVPVDELVQVVSSADVGVMPIQGAILSYYLALPNKLFECLMAGVPVAVSNLPEMARIVEEHRVGGTFDPSDPQDIARAIHAILEDRDYRGMRVRARRLALERYNWDMEAQHLWGAYKAALS